MVGALALKQLGLKDALAVIYQPTTRDQDRGDRLKDAIHNWLTPVVGQNSWRKLCSRSR